MVGPTFQPTTKCRGELLRTSYLIIRPYQCWLHRQPPIDCVSHNSSNPPLTLPTSDIVFFLNEVQNSSMKQLTNHVRKKNPTRLSIGHPENITPRLPTIVPHFPPPPPPPLPHYRALLRTPLTFSFQTPYQNDDNSESEK